MFVSFNALLLILCCIEGSVEAAVLHNDNLVCKDIIILFSSYCENVLTSTRNVSLTGLAVAGGCSIHLPGLDEPAALHPQAALPRDLRRHVHRCLRHFHQVLNCLRALHRRFCPKLLPCKSQRKLFHACLFRYCILQFTYCTF